MKKIELFIISIDYICLQKVLNTKFSLLACFALLDSKAFAFWKSFTQTLNSIQQQSYDEMTIMKYFKIQNMR